MSTHMYQVEVKFQEVAVCFSAEEWGALEEWQKELYRKVIRDIQAAVEEMGFQILHPDVLFRIRKVKDMYIEVCEADRAVPSADPGQLMGLKKEKVSQLDSCRWRGTKTTPHLACSPDILLRIRQEDVSCFSDVPQQSPAHAEPIVTSVFSLQKEEELPPTDRSEVTTGQVISHTIKQEKPDYVKVPTGSHVSDVTSRGRASSRPIRNEDRYYGKVSAVSGSDHTGALARGHVTSKPIKQEELDYIKVSVGGHVPDDTTVTSRDAGDPTIDSRDTAPTSMTQVSNSLVSQSTSSPNLGAPRLRIVKFTEKELDVLVDLVIENYSKLFGKEADITPSVAKNAMWQAIANEVSAVGVAPRTSDKVKKRWKDAKRKMNEKLTEAAAHVAETGRRPPPHLRLAPYEQTLRDFFKPEFSKEVAWNQDKEDQPEEVDAEPAGSILLESLGTAALSPQCQDMCEDSSKDSSEDPSPVSPENRPPLPEAMEERDLVLETPARQFSAINSTLHDLSSHQRESNVLMQEQNAILSQIAFSLNLMQIQQTDGLAALGSIIQRGIEVIHPAPCPLSSHPANEHLPPGLRRQTLGISGCSTDQPVPPKRKIT